MSSKTFSVYILASHTRTLYIGVTSNLGRRLEQHRIATTTSFTTRYRIQRLVYVETYTRAVDAIAREKQLKGWKRARKLALIEDANPRWDDLGDGGVPETR
jgi:putative endonuclease